jgi:septum formation protein
MLLARFGLPFEAVAPGVDEQPLAGERPADTAARLAVLKARAPRQRFPDALIIGSDQVAALGDERFDKPGNYENAFRQLRRLSGNTVDFHTALALLDSKTGQVESRIVLCRVTFRRLDDARIEAYLKREQPYDCAASAKAEELGIVLIERMQTDDPTSIIGLPLIALSEMLERAGMPVV